MHGGKRAFYELLIMLPHDWATVCFQSMTALLGNSTPQHCPVKVKKKKRHAKKKKEAHDAK